MNAGLDFVIVAISTISGLVVILDWLGIKPRQPLWGLLMPLSRNWKLGVMVGLMAISFGFSARGYYKSLHPKIVEKIVEKPVERIVEKPVEKIVQEPCPKPPKPLKSVSSQAPSSVSASGGSIAIGSVAGNGNTVSPSITNNAPPARRLTDADKQILKAHLVGFHSKIVMGYILDASDAYRFAHDLQAAFREFGFEVEDDIMPQGWTNGALLYGVQVEYHGDEIAKGQPAFVSRSSQTAIMVNALAASHVEVSGFHPDPKQSEDTIIVTVSYNPAEQEH